MVGSGVSSRDQLVRVVGFGRRRGWLTPVKVAWLGSAVVVLLLALPINIIAPCDHEKMSCGNVLKTNLYPWLAPTLDGDLGNKRFGPATRYALTGLVEPSGSSR